MKAKLQGSTQHRADQNRNEAEHEALKLTDTVKHTQLLFDSRAKAMQGREEAFQQVMLEKLVSMCKETKLDAHFIPS